MEVLGVLPGGGRDVRRGRQEGLAFDRRRQGVGEEKMPYRCLNCNKFVRIIYQCPECEHGHFECAECGDLTEEDVEEV